MKNFGLVLSLLCMVNFAYCMEQKQSGKQPFSLVDQAVYSLIKSDKVTADTIGTLPIPNELKEMLHSFYSEMQRAEGSYKNALLTMLNLYKSGEKFTSENKRFLSDLLTSSAHEGNKSLVKFLLFLSADVNDNYRFGDTALMWAAGAGHVEVARLLIVAGANINAQAESGSPNNPNYYTALSLATAKGYVEIVELLLSTGANVNASLNDCGHTALMWAVNAGHVEIVKLLLKLDANVNIQAIKSAKQAEQCTALSLATEKGHAEIVNLLKEVGAR